MNKTQNRANKNANLTIAICACVLLLAYTNTMNHTLSSIGIMACIGYAVYYITWFSHFKKKLNYYTIFLSLTLIFYFGQFILLLLGVPMLSGRTILDSRLPFDSLIRTGVFIINAMTCFHIGVLLSTMKNENDTVALDEKNNKKTPDENEIMLLKRAGMLVLLVSFLPSISLLVENINITMIKGYGAIFQSDNYSTGGFDNIRRFLSMFTLPALLMLIIAYRNDKKLIIVKLLLAVYLALYFLSGSRIAGVMLIIALFLIFHYWYKPINTKTILAVVGLAICLLVVASTISNIRNTLYLAENKFQAIIEGLTVTWKQNPLFLALEEAGFSFLTTGTVLTYSPSVIPHQYGLSYIKGIWMLIPNLFWDVHPAASINTDIVFSSFLTRYGGIGSSFIAEAYWNFGYVSLICMIAFGSFVGLITRKLSEYAKRGKALKFFFAIYAGLIFLSYVRSDTVSFWRNSIYYGVLPIAFVWFVTGAFEGSRNKFK